jgi:hypothetical protein
MIRERRVKCRQQRHIKVVYADSPLIGMSSRPRQRSYFCTYKYHMGLIIIMNIFVFEMSSRRIPFRPFGETSSKPLVVWRRRTSHGSRRHRVEHAKQFGASIAILAAASWRLSPVVMIVRRRRRSFGTRHCFGPSSPWTTTTNTTTTMRMMAAKELLLVTLQKLRWL